MTAAPVASLEPWGAGAALRTLLIVPGDTERKIRKALETSADVVILDLEDAVAPTAKAEARAIVCEVLKGDRRKCMAVRINAYDTAHYLDDLAAIGQLGPDIIMLPKAAGGRDVARLDDQISVLEAAAGNRPGKTGILPLVTETAAALAGMDYRGASRRLVALGFAGEDLSADLGVSARDGAGMNPLLAQARRHVAVAAAAAGVAAIDTPFPDPRNEEGLIRETDEAVRMGFTGKLCIHPAQLGPVHDAFLPSAEKLAWAQSVTHAFASSPGEGVVLLDGRMIDRAHLRLANRYLLQQHPAPGEAEHGD